MDLLNGILDDIDLDNLKINEYSNKIDNKLKIIKSKLDIEIIKKSGKDGKIVFTSKSYKYPNTVFVNEKVDLLILKTYEFNYCTGRGIWCNI